MAAPRLKFCRDDNSLPINSMLPTSRDENKSTTFSQPHKRPYLNSCNRFSLNRVLERTNKHRIYVIKIRKNQIKFINLFLGVLCKDKAFLALTLALCMKKKKKGRRWSREWLKLRDKYTHENLLREIVLTEPNDYANFLRMDHKTFEDLLTLLSPCIAKQDTVMRKSIPASQRLSITLRYLASGADFEDLKFQACIAPRTVIQGSWRNESNQLLNIERTRAGNSATLAKEQRKRNEITSYEKEVLQLLFHARREIESDAFEEFLSCFTAQQDLVDVASECRVERFATKRELRLVGELVDTLTLCDPVGCEEVFHGDEAADEFTRAGQLVHHQMSGFRR
ncbi:unnamed protein product [Leptidea sinapis]|uniref:Uncharacterized protein n=1 Tax=Leptidea sinapis TaxID=189913 RepID=A0A5E4QCE9_9NEOP|nr:unnamed protein product [Leptidea sinapis]